MFPFMQSRRVGPLPTKSRAAVSFLSPRTTTTSDPADMFVAGKLKESAANFDERLPSAKSHLDGSGDFKSTEASPIPAKAGAAFKRLFKSRKVGHQHQQKVTVCEPQDEPETTSTDKKGKAKGGLLKRIHNKLKPRKKTFKSAHKDHQEAEPELDVEAEQTDPNSVHASLSRGSVWPCIVDKAEYNAVSSLVLNIPPKEEQKSSLVSPFTGEGFLQETEAVSEAAHDWILGSAAAEKNFSPTQDTTENSSSIAVKSCMKHFYEMKQEETFVNVEEQEEKGSSQTKDSHQAGNTVREDDLPGHSESHEGSVETVEGIPATPGCYTLLQFRKKIFCSDKDPSFTENKEQINADPAVGAEKAYISEDSDRESMLPSKRISANSAVTDQQSENKQDEHQEGPESKSSKVLGSSTEDSSPSDLLLDDMESSRQENTEGPPDQARRSPPELSFKHLSDDFERSIYSRCLEIYRNAYQRHWREMNPRDSSQSATEGVTEPPTSSTECWTKTALEKLSSQPDAPPRNVGSTRSRFKRFRKLAQKRLSLNRPNMSSPRTTTTSDPADMFVAGKLKESAANFDERLPSAKSHLDGSGDFKSIEASPIPAKAGAAFKRLFKSRKVGHQHQQKVTVCEPQDEPEPTSTDKKGKPKGGLLKRIHNKLKPRKKTFKSAHKDRQEAEPELDVEAEQTDPNSVHASLSRGSVWPCIVDKAEYNAVSSLVLNIPPKEEQKSSLVSPFTGEGFLQETEAVSEAAHDWILGSAAAEKNFSPTQDTTENSSSIAVKSCMKHFYEMKQEETFVNVEEQEEKGSSQTKDSHQAGNTVREDDLPGHSESHEGSVETVEGIPATPGCYTLLQFRKKIFCSDKDPSFTENKEQINADPAVGAEKAYISEDSDRESMLPSKRISANSAVTDQQLENKQDEHQEGPESKSSKVLGSSTEDSSPSDLLLDDMESSRQENTEGPPDQARRSPPELSFKHLSDDFERSIYSRCLEIYRNAYQRHWREMNPRDSSQSATEGVTEPPTSSTECWTKTALEKLSSQPEAPPRNVGSTHSRFKRFRKLARKRLSLNRPSMSSPRTTTTSDPADMFVAGKLKESAANFDERLPSAKSHLDGSGDFKSTKASPIPAKAGAAFKRLFKSRKVGHQHQQKVTVCEPQDEPEPTSTDKKGKPKGGLLKRIHNKLKPRKKTFKSAHKDRQEAEPELDVEAEQTDPNSVHDSSQSATEGVTEPPTSSTECWTKTALEKLSSQPEAPPRNVGSTRSRFKRFRKLARKRLSLNRPNMSSPRTTTTSDPADMFVAGKLKESAANFDERLPSAKSHLDGSGDFKSTKASPIPAKAGAAFKRLFKSRKVGHQHQQKVTVCEPQDEPEPTSTDKKGKPEGGLLKRIHNKLKPRKKTFKSAHKDRQEAEPELDVEAEQTDPNSVHDSSQSATEGVTEPPTSSTECWTKTALEKLSSQPEAPPRNVGSTHSRFKRFRKLVRKRLS